MGKAARRERRAARPRPIAEVVTRLAGYEQIAQEELGTACWERLDQRARAPSARSPQLRSKALTANRSAVGMMNEFAFLADAYREDPSCGDDLVRLAVRLAGTPAGPLTKRHGFPDRELLALVEARLSS